MGKVETEKIKSTYIDLVNLVNIESTSNLSVIKFFNYLNTKKNNFEIVQKIHELLELREFIRGANRYSDEFTFTDKNYTEIRTKMNLLFDLLNDEVNKNKR